MHAWSDDEPLRLVEHQVPAKDPDGKAIACYGLYVPAVNQERSAQIKTYGDILRRHRDEHALAWLTEAIHMALETGDAQSVLQRFLHLEAQPA